MADKPTREEIESLLMLPTLRLSSPMMGRDKDRPEITLAVRVVQMILRIKADGIYGEGTEQRVRIFQAVHKLKIDGVVGCATWQKLLER